MINRRRFLQSIAAAASLPAVVGCKTRDSGFSSLRGDPEKIIELPPGFSYTVVSRRGDPMSDGLSVPAAHDGMAAFPGPDGQVILITNHELRAEYVGAGPFGDTYEQLDTSVKSCLYDRGGDKTPGTGGTTTTIYDPATRSTAKQFLSLGGTEINCAGGKTPWGTWLSCEECFEDEGVETLENGDRIFRDQRHGYIFEVPAAANKLVPAVPLRAMGRFEHEAAAVHEPSGVVYLTEDRWHSLFYRFLPNVPGQLHKGGRLQALVITDRLSQATHNWDDQDIRVGDAMRVHWIDLDNVDGDGDDNDLRLRGAAAGAATFARGEGLTAAGDRLVFTCTIGGFARLGHVFSYRPSPFEGTDQESATPAQLTLIAEANAASLLKNCDNLTMAPWGDLVLCEDAVGVKGQCALIGMRADGSQYAIANNAYSDSELAGVCFSPDGKTLFVNIQIPGMTIAITGPWPN